MNAASAPSLSFLHDDHTLACIHCGLCLGSCPTYLETGNENDSPRGRIYLMRALQAGSLPLGQTVVRHIDLCLGCRACEAACPSGVRYGALIEAAREHIEKCYRRSLWQRFLRHIAIEQVFPFPARMRWALRLASLAKKLGVWRWLPRFAAAALDLLPESVRTAAWPEVSPASIPERRGRVGLVQGCVQSVLFNDTNAATVRLLNRVGWEVITPPGQVCCGALYAHSGNLEQARACARHNLEVFERFQLDAVIINAAGCGSTLKEYGELLAGEGQWADRARQFSARVKDLSEWLAGSNLARHPPVPGHLRVTYHDACHLAHAQHITQPPRDLLRAVAGPNFVELPESEVCCGSAGSYNLTEPEMAERLQRRKIENILKTGAQVVVTANPGCLLQIQAGLRKAGAGHIRVMHLADYLCEGHDRPEGVG